MPRTVKRQYRSALRAQRAVERGSACYYAAHDLFANQGRADDDRRDRRGGRVAARDRLRDVPQQDHAAASGWYLTIRGDDADVPLYDRPEMQAILPEPDLAARIRKQRRVRHGDPPRVAPLYTALIGAAANEQAAADLLAEFRGVASTSRPGTRGGGQERSARGHEEHCRDVVFALPTACLAAIRGRPRLDRRALCRLAAELWISQLVARHPRRRPCSARLIPSRRVRIGGWCMHRDLRAPPSVPRAIATASASVPAVSQPSSSGTVCVVGADHDHAADLLAPALAPVPHVERVRAVVRVAAPVHLDVARVVRELVLVLLLERVRVARLGQDAG
jgi:hypothetical protein